MVRESPQVKRHSILRNEVIDMYRNCLLNLQVASGVVPGNKSEVSTTPATLTQNYVCGGEGIIGQQNIHRGAVIARF